MKSPSEFFVVIAEQRSGSTFLKNSLSIQKDIFCYSTANLEKKFSDFGQTFDYRKDRKNRANWRSGNNGKLIVKLAHSILLKNKGDKKLFGFKCHPHRVLTIPNYFEFLSNKNAKIIFLTRDNILLRFISRETILQRTNDSRSHYVKKQENNKVFKLNSVNIEYKKYIKYKSKTEREKKNTLFNINKYNLPYIHITYEELSGNFDQCLNKIFDFLELDKGTIINCKGEDGTICGHKKINVYKLQDKILNYEEFKKAAQDNNDIETLNFLKEP
jgi:LPS sulfotransferase NodH